MRGACYSVGKEFESDYIEAMYRCMWEQDLKMDDPSIISKALHDHHLPAEEIIAGSQNPATKKILIDSTSYSVEKGNFGSPTFFVGNEMFFGKDRLLDVEEEILSQR
jgi:2-hydroxychromene-2-carboxylate isomerase